MREQPRPNNAGISSGTPMNTLTGPPSSMVQQADTPTNTPRSEEPINVDARNSEPDVDFADTSYSDFYDVKGDPSKSNLLESSPLGLILAPLVRLAS